MSKKSCDGSIFEITVESLQGICLDNAYDAAHLREGFTPQVTATVAFAGSVPNMEVGSSSVCGRTGQLLVESMPLEVDQNAEFNDRRCWLSATWKDREKEAAASGTKVQPHLKVQLPSRNKDFWPKSGLSSSNRDSTLFRAEVDDGDNTTHSSGLSAMSGRRSTAASIMKRGASAIWSNSGAHPLPEILPEIVELNVRLKCPSEKFVEQVGIAYLVVFGNEEDSGNFVMELPVKQPSSGSLPKDKRSPSFLLTDKSRLKVHLKVKPTKINCKHFLATSVSTATTAAETVMTDDFSCSPSQMNDRLGPLIMKLKESEEEAIAMREAQKRAMDIEVPLNGNGLERRFICGDPGMWSWDQLLRTMSCAVPMRCNPGITLRRTGSDVSVDSTIATRDSLHMS